MIQVPASVENGLSRDSGANVLQIRSVSTERFIDRLGQVEAEILEEVLGALIVCIDYEG